MRIGFTGTRDGMTRRQLQLLHEFLMDKDITEFHHGGARGADTEAHWMVIRTLCVPWDRVHVWPAEGRNLHALKGIGVMHPAAPPLYRNKTIVDSGLDLLVATPKERTEILRSGTWATVRYARKVGRPVHIIHPYEEPT